MEEETGTPLLEEIVYGHHLGTTTLLMLELLLGQTLQV